MSEECLAVDAARGGIQRLEYLGLDSGWVQPLTLNVQVLLSLTKCDFLQ